MRAAICDYEHLFKLVVIGESGVRKSNLLSRFTTETFDSRSRETIGVEVGAHCLQVDGKTIEAQILLVHGGTGAFRTVVPAYYLGAELERYTEPRLAVLLVGNKSDLRPHAVSNEEAAEWA
ncbi:hypothetical protein M3Y99_00143400 [Aphelenchoides fujianensis]|nr:hypothetical protein M3Y99_00143400 [Aphelenchoides fujianensis]